ncbi:TORTIFOLIA1-like protein 2 [Zingiber officinale]|uniref:TORTIFOLIA1-like protein 2 n=1 Tax=Zingiber officinale TaxID=94328 RepID=UPI001C4B4051|nr:TORTIFOLIA1-like protein 2 [Zingiber officinale]
MATRSSSKARPGAKPMQQAVFELKQRVVLSLNKLADRDTHRIGLEELERLAENLSPEMVAPFLSCVAETDSDQKSAVRRDSVLVMGTLARSYGTLLVPHCGKIISSILRRLKDTDSAVRDACIETCGVLATSMAGTGGGEGETVFVALAKPLFEALGEQNRYVQVGAALCLARVIDEASDAPQSIFPQMLARIIKLLKNQHFMAKPAIIELIRSIIQAGFALATQTLSAAVNSILDALKSNDWATRKTASLVLAAIAVNPGSSLAPLRNSCIRSLESCRFDKVKPVRDSVLHAIQCWRVLQGSGSPVPSEVGSSIKENFGGDINDVTSDNGWGDSSFRKTGSVSFLSGISTSSTQKTAPAPVRKLCKSNTPNGQRMKLSDWQVEISVPKTRAMSLVTDDCREPSRVRARNAFERRVLGSTQLHDTVFDCGSVDDKPDLSCVSDLASRSHGMKHEIVSQYCRDNNSSTHIRGNNISTAEDTGPDCTGHPDRKSVDSTVTDSCSNSMHGCCLRAANELSFIKQKLFEIETKQSNLLDLLKVLTENSMDNLLQLHSKVKKLEHVVDGVTRSAVECENLSSLACSKLVKQEQTVTSSLKLTTLTPRASVDKHKLRSPLSSKSMGMWGENISPIGRSNISVKEAQFFKDSALDKQRNPIDTCKPNNSGRNLRSVKGHGKDRNNVTDSVSNLEAMSGIWKRVDSFLNMGNIESAYVEAILSNDDLTLVQLMDRTGPVLDRLSLETTNDVLTLVAANFADQRFLERTIPWLQQVVELSKANGLRQLFLSTKAQTEFLFALQEAATRVTADPALRMSISPFVAKLHHLWLETPCRRNLPPRG